SAVPPSTHAAPPPGADPGLDHVRANATANEISIGPARPDVGSDLKRWRFDEAGRVRLTRHQRLDLAPERRVAGTRFIEQRQATTMVLLQCLRVDLLDPLPAFATAADLIVHGCSPRRSMG